MTYKEATEHWIDELFLNIEGNKLSVEDAKRAILERILQSFKNGLRAKPRGQAPVSQPATEQA